jgi:hypothetical protein
MGKCRLGKRHHGQMMYGQMSRGKYLWAKIEWANVIEPSTCVQFCVRIGVRFRAQFACGPDKDPILHQTPITMVCVHT